MISIIISVNCYRILLSKSFISTLMLSDFMTVCKGLAYSVKWAGSAKRRFSRIWTTIHANLEEAVEHGVELLEKRFLRKA